MAWAFWMSHDGTLYPVESSHIAMVIARPGMFGISLEYIEYIFNYFGEEMGTEGRARQCIILELVRKGWVRIRHYPRQGYWTVNVHSVSDRIMQGLYNWALKMIGSGVSPRDMVKLDMPGKQIMVDMFKFTEADTVVW